LTRSTTWRPRCTLIATCLRDAALRVGDGRGGRLDSDASVASAILSETRVDPFARDLRRNLRRKHGIDCSRRVGVWALFSDEPPIAPQVLAYDDGAFRLRVPPVATTASTTGEHKAPRRGLGRVSWPSVFGAAAASLAVRLLLRLPLPRPLVADAPPSTPAQAGCPHRPAEAAPAPIRTIARTHRSDPSPRTHPDQRALVCARHKTLCGKGSP